MATNVDIKTHVVQQGSDANTLNRIAKEIGKDVRILEKLNPSIEDSEKALEVGTKILIGVGSITDSKDDFAVATLKIYKDDDGSYKSITTDESRGTVYEPVELKPNDKDKSKPDISFDSIVNNNDDFYDQKLDITTLMNLNPTVPVQTQLQLLPFTTLVLEVFVPGSDNMVEVKECGIQIDTTRTCYIKWEWNHKANNTSGVEIVWEWLASDGKSWHSSKTSINDTEQFEHTYNPDEKAVKVRVKIRPVDKNAVSTALSAVGVETASKYKWTTAKEIDFSDELAIITPSAPSVEIENYKLTATYESLPIITNEVFDENGNVKTVRNITHVQFQVVQDNQQNPYNNDSAYMYEVGAIDGYVQYTCKIEAGHKYKVRARCCKKVSDELIYYSSWSQFSNLTESLPTAPIFKECKVMDNNLVRFKWSKVESAKSYDLEYLIKDPEDYKNFNSPEDYFAHRESNATKASIAAETAVENNGDIVYQPYRVGDNTGAEYLTRVCAINNVDNSDWSNILSFILGKTPDAPTTWSSTTTVVIGEMLRLYWVHNSKDGSAETMAKITYWPSNTTNKMYIIVTRTTDNTLSKISINNKVTLATLIRLNPTLGSNDILPPGTLVKMEGNKYMFVYNIDEPITSYFEVNTSTLKEGNKINWYVQTAGAYRDSDGTPVLGPVSIERTVDIYAPPTLNANLLDFNKEALSQHPSDEKLRLTSLPFYVRLSVGNTANQKPTGYYVSVIAKTSYNTVDEVGNNKAVVEGNKVFSKYYDVSDTSYEVEVSAHEITLENNEEYEVVCTASMSSGLRAEFTTEPFKVAWLVRGFEPNAEIGIDKDKLTALIRPYSYAQNDSVILSVYRREYDGTFTEIATDLDNTQATWVTDPHPALDYARYRIVSKSKSTSVVSYFDVPAFPVQEHSVVIQWDEQWQSFDVDEDELSTSDVEQAYTGSMLKLPYNIDVSNSHSPDVSLVKYIGRKRPVSYYGTQLGESATWNVEIPKNDKETLYALRRLSIYMGNVYVREPSGSGYWATINVSFSQKHLGLTIPVTLNITPVEGGM